MMKRRFTLVELLIVISVIAILVSLLRNAVLEKRGHYICYLVKLFVGKHCRPVKISAWKLAEIFKLFGRIPVRRLRNGLAVQCEDFEQGKILHKRIADSIR